VVLVTHNSCEFLDDTLASIAQQDQPADFLIAIDDHSTDNTRDTLESAGFAVELSTSPAMDTTTRIAHNFVQGLRRAHSKGADIVVLGDHDDVWHRTRISHQVALLEEDVRLAMVASNGYLIDEYGVAVAGTLRDTFPIPDDFASWSASRKWTFALRHSLATGGACAIRPSGLADWSVPAGWLHDRWWSLASLRASALLLDPSCVIDYRISRDQQIGLRTAGQDAPARWWVTKAMDASSTASRAVDVIGMWRR